MARKITPKRAIAAGSALLIVAATLAMVLPAGADTPSAVRLHLATDGRYFAYGNTVQNLTPAKNGCQISSAESIISLTAAPGTQAVPGLGPDGIGVKPTNNSSNGTPCSQVDGSEVLTMSKKAGGSLGSRAFIGVALDLELTGNAVAKLAFTPAAGGSPVEYTLQTGNFISQAQTLETDYDTTAPYDVTTDPATETDRTDACAAPNSSGPNSGSSDNCRWTVYPGFDFTTFSLRTTSGTVSLEGAGDFGGAAARETLLFLSNSAPTAANDTATTNEDTATDISVLTNDSDPDGNSLTPSVQSGPSHGTAVVQTNGTIRYTPTGNYNGTDSFTYRVSDGVLNSGNATVGITVTAVNDPPVPSTQGSSTNEDQSVVVTIATDIDSSDGSGSCALTDSGGNTLDGNVVNGAGFTVTVTPPLNFFGTMTLTCTVTDAEGASATSQTTISVGVTSVNDAPVAVDDPDTGDPPFDVDENSFVDIDVVTNDLDVEHDALTPVQIGSILPAGATATANLDGTVRYTPPADYVGPGSFTYKANDGSATSANSATVSITVFAVMCSTDTVSDADGTGSDLVSGSFTRLTDSEDCKRYTVDAVSGSADTVTFNPTGSATVAYSGTLQFPADAPPVGQYPLLLQYDPDGGTNFKPVQWCVNPQFSGGLVVSATLPDDGDPDTPPETWCVANADTTPNADGDLVTVWQVYGEDDPKFTR